MSRSTLAVDRVVAFLVSLILVGGGVALLLWGTRQLSAFDGAPDLSALQRAADKSWWPWAVGGAGLALVLLGLRWLLAHVPNRRVRRVRLSGSDRSGRLSAAARPVAEAAAEALAAEPGVRSATGAVLRDRGQTVARIVATIDPAADLPSIATSAERISADIRNMLGRDDLRCRVQLRLARGRSTLSRAR